jgi:gliding motility-associated-like protein
LYIYSNGNGCGGLGVDSIKHEIWIAGNFSVTVNDTTACIIKDMKIGVPPMADANYLWSTGSTNDTITVNAPGKYWVQVKKSGCEASDTMEVFQTSPPVVNLGKDTAVCSNQGIFLFAGNSSTSTYLWNTGETTSYIFVKNIGEYSVTVTENSCVATDTVAVEWGDCEIYIPSAFSPNGDSRNESFGVLSGFRAKSFFLQVFNKSGQPVFATSDINEKWDGTFKRSKQPMGAYVWILHYVNSNNERKFQTGTVMLIR